MSREVNVSWWSTRLHVVGVRKAVRVAIGRLASDSAFLVGLHITKLSLGDYVARFVELHFADERFPLHLVLPEIEKGIIPKWTNALVPSTVRFDLAFKCSGFKSSLERSTFSSRRRVLPGEELLKTPLTSRVCKRNIKLNVGWLNYTF